MKRLLVACAMAVGLGGICSPALADDPNAYMSPEDLARDHETIRQMNLNEQAYVRERDARYAKDWEAYRRMKAAQEAPLPAPVDPTAARRAYERATGAPGFEGQSERVAAYEAQMRDYQMQRQRFADAQADYQRRMYSWRRQVAACNAGYYDACD